MRTEKNNFQQLMEEQAREYEEDGKGAIEKNLLHTFGIFKFVGQIVDVFLPAMLNVLVSSAGGKEQPHSGGKTPPSLGEDHPGKVGPHPPDDNLFR